MNRTKCGSLIASVLFLPLAQAQDAPKPATPAARVETSVSLGVGAQLTATRVFFGQPFPAVSTLGAQSFDPSATVLGSLRQSFHPWLGYSVNLGYTRTTQEDTGAASFSNGTRLAIPSNVYEVSVAYLAEKHFTPRLTGFASVGGGVLAFLPVQSGPLVATPVPASIQGEARSYQSRPLGVGGAGFDFALGGRLALRAEYRGLLYKFPDHDGTVSRQLTVTSQPTVSLVYRFGAKP